MTCVNILFFFLRRRLQVRDDTEGVGSDRKWRRTQCLRMVQSGQLRPIVRFRPCLALCTLPDAAPLNRSSHLCSEAFDEHLVVLNHR